MAQTGRTISHAEYNRSDSHPETNKMIIFKRRSDWREN